MGISSDKISLFSVFTGPRGSLKTLILVSIICERLIKAYYLNKYCNGHNRVFSNFPVKFWHRDEVNGDVVLLEAEPLNMEALITFDSDLVYCWVFIDELDQYYDRQDWQNASQKLTNAGLTQIRKRKMSLGATVQDLDWINSRTQFQVDIQAECREAAFSAFGSKMGLGLGEASFVKWKDLSGTRTGYMFKETGKYYQQTFWGKRFWDCYDTNYQFDPMETKTRYKLKRNTKTIEYGTNNSLPDNVEQVEPLHSIKQDPVLVMVSHACNDFKKLGLKMVSKIDIRKKLTEFGYEGNWQKIGMTLDKIGVFKTNSTGNVYSIEALSSNFV